MYKIIKLRFYGCYTEMNSINDFTKKSEYIKIKCI